MLCDVTNRSDSPRGLQTRAGTTTLVEPGDTVKLDLADHPLHDVWAAAGEITIVPEAKRADRTTPAPSRRPAKRPPDAD